MALRGKLFATFESFLRVPPLLLMDEILRHSFGLGLGTKLAEYAIPPEESTSLEHSSNLVNNDRWYHPLESLWKGLFLIFAQSKVPSAGSDTSNSLMSSEYLFHVSLGNTEMSIFHQLFSKEVLRSLDVFACLILFGGLLIMFVLSSRNLITLYSYLLSCLTLYISYIVSPFPRPHITWSEIIGSTLILNVIGRVLLALLYLLTSTFATPDNNQESRSLISKLIDYRIIPLFFVTGIINLSPATYILLVIILEDSARVKISKVYTLLKSSWDETKRVRHEFGISHLIQVESGRLGLYSVFRLFWISRAAYDALYKCCDVPASLVFKYVMTRGTETLTGIVGITAVISCIANQFGEFLLWILYLGGNTESDANRFGSISTVLFFILSLQTGLTSLDPEKRLDRLFKNVVLLATALFHALHQMLAPILHAFRAFQGLQIRAVFLSILFFAISIYSTICLLQTSPISTWSLAVLALAIEFKVKIIVSLIISTVVYMSQLIQYPTIVYQLGRFYRVILPNCIVRFFLHLSDEISHEDLIFYLKSFANMAEFLTGIFLFTNAIWIFLFESASAIRAIGMSIHAYFNIWCEAKKGWKIYCQRRTAAAKIMSLKDATEAQLLDKKDDVCAICYEEMEYAKVTFCSHLFHAACLRKWLYLQNTCPLCHELLYSEDILSLSERQQQQHHQQPTTEHEPGEEDEGDRGRHNRHVIRRDTRARTIAGIRYFPVRRLIRPRGVSDNNDESESEEEEVDTFSSSEEEENERNEQQPNHNGGLVVFL